MTDTLRVLIHGTGYAGQGHTEAFRSASVDVVGMVGRTEAVVTDVAKQMGIPFAGTNWDEALTACNPDIVSIGTPGGAHFEPITKAIAHGCHVFCDKPLAESGATAREMYQLATDKGVKTAFAASFRYMPEVLHAKRLIEAGAIGEPQEVECISHFNLERDIPFGWSHRKEDGGGRLNNNFTHKLSIVTSVLGETLLDLKADVRDDLGKAPIVEGVHNFKTRRELIPEDLEDPSLQWGQSNVEWSYTVIARIKSEMASQPVSILFRHGGLQPRFNEDHIVFYGSQGAIYIKGHYGSGPLFLYGDSKEWREVPLPNDIAADVPPISDDTQRNWQYLVREFVRDIRGESYTPYQTFKDGSRYQQIIDLIRENEGWVDMSQLG